MSQFSKKLLANLFGSKRTRIRRRANTRRVRLEVLEARALMAADIGIVGGVLTINADPAGTNAVVFDPNPYSALVPVQVITTSPNGNSGLAVPKNSFGLIRFNGSDQADQFTNNTSHPSLAYGYGGNDILQGGSTADTLWGQNGEDTLGGGGGNDILYGGNDNDVLEGSAGNDSLYGQAGNDHLFGGSGNDALYGGAGMDGLYGDDGLDTYNGGAGADRFLNNTSEGLQFLADLQSDDVMIHFSPAGAITQVFNGTTTNWGAGSWTTQDILQVDRAFEALARRTGNNVLLVDVDGSELNFYRHGTYSDDNPNISYSAYNSGEATYYSDSVFTSEDNVFRVVVHEIAHYWDTADEVDMRLPGQGNTIINGFQSISGWKKGSLYGTWFPSYDVSLDGKWSYKSTATFARNYGRTNPFEDFATAFDAYFLDFDNRDDIWNDLDAIPLKWLSQNWLLNQLSNVQFSNSAFSATASTGLAASGNSSGQGTQLIAGNGDPDPAPMEVAVAAVNAISVDLSGGKIDILGTSMDDLVNIMYVDGVGGAASNAVTAWVRVVASNSDGVSTSYFSADSIDSICFTGGAGNDAFVNLTSISSEASGGSGNDVLIGGSATDTFWGGAGNDMLRGGGGNDVLSGDDGDDTLIGDQGDDFLVGGTGDDTLRGGLGDDHLLGNVGRDALNGDSGNDILEGGHDDDMLFGGDGRDVLIGGTGRDHLEGGHDDDLLVGDQLAFNNSHIALHAIWSEWTSPHDYGTRVRNIGRLEHPDFANRLNANSFLVRDVTVIDDGALDTLYGQDGRDLFFSEIGIDLTDALNFEVDLH